MPNRIIREGILTSEAVNSLSCAAEVFYRRLLNVVDDFGRYHANPSLLRAACYPLLLHKVGDPDIVKWTAEAREAGLVRLFTVDGRRYLHITKFDQRVRAEKSKFPPPPPDDGHPGIHGPPCRTNDGHLSVRCQTAARLDGDVVGVEDDLRMRVETAGSAPDGARHASADLSKTVIELPTREGQNFAVKQALVAELEPLYPAVDVPQTLREMKGWLIGNRDRLKTRKKMNGFITRWLQREQEKHGGQAT
jgi:hypothetical protein